MHEKHSHNVQKNGPDGKPLQRQLFGDNVTGFGTEIALPSIQKNPMMPFLFGSSEKMKELERRIAFISRSGLPVLIEGACGTGKESLAERLHEQSGIKGDFVRVLCQPSGLVVRGPGKSSEVSDPGQLYASVRGSLFLKNVHLLSSDAQQQFLSAVEQSSEFDQSHTEAAAARLISSATETLEESVEHRGFLSALYYRLSVHRVSLPPLRERIQDIPELFRLMVLRAANGTTPAPAISSRVLDALMEYEWPGNLRELHNMARTCVATGDTEELIAELASRTKAPLTANAAEGAHLSLREQVRGASQKLESEIILRTLERHRWNRRRAAASLRISYRALLYKMKNCNLRIEPQSAREGTEGQL